MQRLGAAIVATIAWAWSGAAAAQGVSGTQIANQCTAESAFGQTFGAENVNGAATIRLSNSQMVNLPATFAPFREAEVVFTIRSRRIHTITGMARFDSEAAAAAAFDAAVEVLEADPRFAASEEEYEDSIAFYTTAPDQPTGLKADISVSGREIVYFCTDSALFRQTLNELAGRDIAADTPRPTPPQLALPTVPTNSCDTAEGRAALLSGFEPQVQEIIGYGAEANRYSETLMHWANAQMIAQGVWTQEDSAGFGLQLLNDPEFARRFETSLNAAMRMIGAAMSYSEATDDTTRCARAYDTLASAHETVSSTQAQWTLLTQRYQAEAQRRGGTLTLQ